MPNTATVRERASLYAQIKQKYPTAQARAQLKNALGTTWSRASNAQLKKILGQEGAKPAKSTRRKQLGGKIEAIHPITQDLQKKYGFSDEKAALVNKKVKQLALHAAKKLEAKAAKTGKKPTKEEYKEAIKAEIKTAIANTKAFQKPAVEPQGKVTPKVVGKSAASHPVTPGKPKSHADFIQEADKLIPPALKSKLGKLKVKQDVLAETEDRVNKIVEQLKNPAPKTTAKERNELRSEARMLMEERNQLRSASETEAVALMGEFRKTLLASGDKKQATAFTKSVKIDKSALEGKSRKELEEDMMDYHLLTGGKGISTIKTFTKTKDRAHASPQDKIVNVGSNPSKAIMLHEMAHHMEVENPEFAKAAADWVKSRSTSPEPQKLKDLTGNPNYRDNEIAYPDKFISPYVGKVYKKKDGSIIPASEVISMGVERFSSPEAMVKFYKEDPEHFKLVLGMMKAKK